MGKALQLFGEDVVSYLQLVHCAWCMDGLGTGGVGSDNNMTRFGVLGEPV